MRKSFLLLLCFLFILVSATTASALTYNVASEVTFGTDGKYINTGDWFGWVHEYDFDPALDEILSASLTLTIVDNEADDNFWTKEVAIVFTEGWNIAGFEFDSGDYSLSLNSWGLENGRYGVGIYGLWGDFYLTSSMLSIDYTSPGPEVEGTAPVPEPATMVLLGIGLVGLAGLSRKKSKNGQA
jgi:hypothetical protein